MKVREAMAGEVATIRADASIIEAMQLMLERKVSGLPVVDAAGSLVGIITEGDLMRRAELATERRRPRWLQFITSPGRLAADYLASHSRNVADVMTREVFTVNAEVSLADAVQLLEKHAIKRLPVLDQGHVVGMLSRADIMHAYVSLPPASAETPATDDAILRRITDEIDAQPWCPQSILIQVREGAAEISGVITDDRTRAALRVLVQNVAGVKRVVDRLVTVEPLSGLVVTLPAQAQPPAP